MYVPCMCSCVEVGLLLQYPFTQGCVFHACVQVSLQQVSLTMLCLGTCPHLTSLAVSGPHLQTMDLK